MWRSGTTIQIFFIFFFVILIKQVDCAHTYSKNKQLSIPEPDIAKLGPGDVFQVKVYEDNTLSDIYQVSSTGTIDFPLIGRLKVEGLTPSEVVDLIKTKLIEGKFIKDPHISIFVKEWNSRKISVFGEVQKPGTFQYEAGMTIVQAISLAGGFTNIADANHTRVIRIINGVEKRFILPVKEIGEGRAPNFYLKPGDIIFVPERLF